MCVPRQGPATVIIWPIPEEMTHEEAMEMRQELIDWGINVRSEDGYIRHLYVEKESIYLAWEYGFVPTHRATGIIEGVITRCNGKYVVFNPYSLEVSVLCKEAVDEFYKLLPGQRWGL